VAGVQPLSTGPWDAKGCAHRNCDRSGFVTKYGLVRGDRIAFIPPPKTAYEEDQDVLPNAKFSRVDFEWRASLRPRHSCGLKLQRGDTDRRSVIVWE